MRAIAVLAVAFNHANVRGFGGGYVGVDVFFVISGFLITGWLLRRVERDGRLPFGGFYAARARRILPASALAIVATVAAAHWLMNYVRALSVYHDAVWAALFLANVRFARIGTDYFQQGLPPSPLQHFWSLAVEEQFYLVWPALLALLLVVSRGRRWVLLAGVALAGAASLGWSIADTADNRTAAYFSSPARAWELAVGALLALVAADVGRAPARLRALAGWAGLAAIVVAVVAYSSATPFPGYAALLPVLGSAALIAANGAGPGRLLAVRPLTYTGDISYSFYLWHWPFLVIAADRAGHPLTVKENLMLLGIAYALAATTYRFFENPLRHARALSIRPWRALTLWPVTVGAVLVIALLGIQSVDAQSSTAAQVGAGPTVMVSAKHATADPIVALVARSVAKSRRAARVKASSLAPPLASLSHDLYNMAGCTAGFGSKTSSRICHWGDPAGTKTLVVFGDSHAQMWMLPITAWAAGNGWQVIPLVKEGCVAVNWAGVRETDACKQWFAWATQEAKQLAPDATLLITASSPHPGASAANDASAEKGIGTEIEALAGAAPKLAVLQDTPYLLKQPADCLLARHATYGSCTFAQPPDKTSMDAAIRSRAVAAHATWLPTAQWFCAKGLCPTVIGSSIAYVDQGHISQTYARAVKASFARELAAAVG